MATHIKTLIDKFIKEEKKNINEKERVEKIVNKYIERKLKKEISFVKIYHNNLIFSCPSPHYGFEFNLKKRKLLKEVKKELPQIKDIKIKINTKKWSPARPKGRGFVASG